MCPVRSVTYVSGRSSIACLGSRPGFFYKAPTSFTNRLLSSRTPKGATFLAVRSPGTAPARNPPTTSGCQSASEFRHQGLTTTMAMATASSSSLGRAIPLWLIVLCALAFHGPLLMIQVPANSFDANFHMSMASHYAHHWFDPWNEKAFAGFSQTTYPPLTHQWIAMFSHVIGLTNGFMLVLGICLLLLPVGVYRFSKLWTSDRAASYAAFGSVFLGSLCLLAYQDGQIGTISATTLFLLSLPYLYRYVLRGEFKDLILGLFISLSAAAAHHA